MAMQGQTETGSVQWPRACRITTSTWTPPEESTSPRLHVCHHHGLPNTPVGVTHNVLSILEQATSREGQPTPPLHRLC